MTEEKMILNDGQYDLDMRTREVNVSADVLAGKGWRKLDSNEQIAKKVELTKEEAEWFEEHKHLPFFNIFEVDYFLSEIVKHWTETKKGRTYYVNLFSRAYFAGYTIKEKKYYIKLGFGFSGYLNISENGDWWWARENSVILGRSQFTQDEIDEMQKDPRAKGLDLNELKVEVPEDELED